MACGQRVDVVATKIQDNSLERETKAIVPLTKTWQLHLYEYDYTFSSVLHNQNQFFLKVSTANNCDIVCESNVYMVTTHMTRVFFKQTIT